MEEKRKVFISFYNKDIEWKERILKINEKFNIFIDWSVDAYDISDDLNDEQIRVKIRDEYIKESSVTIVLASSDAFKRKHVDWEIGSSMIDTENNRRSGIVVLLIDDLENQNILTSDSYTRELLEPTNWKDIDEKNFYEWYKYITNQRLYVNLKKRIKKPNESIPIQILRFSDIEKNHKILKRAIEYTYESRNKGTYDISIPFYRKNL